jgi:hypothetical protein
MEDERSVVNTVDDTALFDAVDEVMMEEHEPNRLENESRKDWRQRLKTWQRDRKGRKSQEERENNLSETLIRNVAEAIKQDNETWCFMETELLMEFIRLSIRKYIHDEGGVKAFKNGVADEEELKQKIKAAFDASPDSRKVTADQVMRLNAAYAQGKQYGNIPRKVIRKLLKKET